jgi:hypothetical protein
MIFIALQALTEVLFSFAVSPFSNYCSGKLFCTRFTCAIVIALILHGGGEGDSWWWQRWVSIMGVDGQQQWVGRRLLKVGAWPGVIIYVDKLRVSNGPVFYLWSEM